MASQEWDTPSHDFGKSKGKGGGMFGDEMAGLPQMMMGQQALITNAMQAAMEDDRRRAAMHQNSPSEGWSPASEQWGTFSNDFGKGKGRGSYGDFAKGNGNGSYDDFFKSNKKGSHDDFDKDKGKGSYDDFAKGNGKGSSDDFFKSNDKGSHEDFDKGKGKGSGWYDGRDTWYEEYSDAQNMADNLRHDDVGKGKDKGHYEDFDGKGKGKCGKQGFGSPFSASWNSTTTSTQRFSTGGVPHGYSRSSYESADGNFSSTTTVQSTTDCPACEGKGAFDVWGEACERSDMHYKEGCVLCKGRGTVFGLMVKCGKC